MFNIKFIKMKNYWILIVATVLFLVGLTLNLFIGGMFSANEYCINYFASGDYAIGVFAAGKFSIGIFSAGIFSVGIFSIGIFNVGLYAVGIFVFGYKKRLPKTFISEFKNLTKELLINKGTKVILVVLFLGMSSLINAQSVNRVSLVGGFGGPMFQISSVDSKIARSTGGGGAAVFSNGLLFGGYGIGTSHNSNTESSISGYEIETEYGGLWIGYIKKLKKGFEISGSIKNGWGEFKLVNIELQSSYFDKIYVFIPEISVSKKVFGISMISIGLLYNQFLGLDLQGYTNANLSSIGASISLKFGFY
jgi:hypothetical protein